MIDFRLLETLLWRPRSGFFLLDRHLARLDRSARHFGFAVDVERVERRLRERAEGFAPERIKVRLLAARDGLLEIEASPAPCPGRRPLRVALDAEPVRSDDPFLRHKTTERAVYEQALARRPGLDDVVLWNERGELTESTRANLVLELGGEWMTPALESGLLPGTYREALVERGRLREAVLPVTAFEDAERALLINSVRGWMRVERIYAVQ